MSEDKPDTRIYIARTSYRWTLGFSTRQVLDALPLCDGEVAQVKRLAYGCHNPRVDSFDGHLAWDGPNDQPELVGHYRQDVDDEFDEREWKLIEEDNGDE